MNKTLRILDIFVTNLHMTLENSLNFQKCKKIVKKFKCIEKNL